MSPCLLHPLLWFHSHHLHHLLLVLQPTLQHLVGQARLRPFHLQSSTSFQRDWSASLARKFVHQALSHHPLACRIACLYLLQLLRRHLLVHSALLTPWQENLLQEGPWLCSCLDPSPLEIFHLPFLWMVLLKVVLEVSS